LSTGPP